MPRTPVLAQDGKQPTFDQTFPKARFLRMAQRLYEKKKKNNRGAGCTATFQLLKTTLCQALRSTRLFVCMFSKLESFKNMFIYTGLEKKKKKNAASAFFPLILFFFFKKS